MKIYATWPISTRPPPQAIGTSALEWVRALVSDLAEGRLTWDAALIQETLEQFG